MKSKFSTIAFAGVVLCFGTALTIEHMHNGYLFVSQASAASAMAPSFSSDADMKKLIGTNIKNGNGDTVGEVKSVKVDGTGKISNVIVSVGGFLGVGDREVAISWNDITVSDDGKKVTTALSKDTLKAMPEYKYKNASWRGTIFHE